MTRVIITRAEPGHSQTARHVKELGLIPVCAPMLHLREQAVPMPQPADYGALLFTSANGVRFFAGRADINEWGRKLTAYCVGPATMQAAQLAGFGHCLSADGNAQDLSKLVKADHAPTDGKLLHIANAAAAGELAQTLRMSGLEVDFLPLYAAEPETQTDPDVKKSLAAAVPTIVLIHSAKAAKAFAALYTLPVSNRHILIAVSEKAAAPLHMAGFAETLIADRPNEAALMACLSISSARL